MDRYLSQLECPNLFVYLASRFENAPAMRAFREELTKRGIFVTSRWLEREERGDGLIPASEDFKQACAKEDIADIEDADVLVVDLSFDKLGWTTHGCIFESGYALGIDLPIIVIGDNESVFWSLDEIQRVATQEEAIELLEEMAGE